MQSFGDSDALFEKSDFGSRGDLSNYLEQLQIDPQPAFFDPCSHLAILMRFLKNLTSAFEKLGESDKVEEVQELLRLLED